MHSWGETFFHGVSQIRSLLEFKWLMGAGSRETSFLCFAIVRDRRRFFGNHWAFLSPARRGVCILAPLVHVFMGVWSYQKTVEDVAK